MGKPLIFIQGDLRETRLFLIFLYFSYILIFLIFPYLPISYHWSFSSSVTLCEKCPYLELFWSVFSRIRTTYGGISPYSVRTGKIRTRIIPNTNSFYAVLEKETSDMNGLKGLYRNLNIYTVVLKLVKLSNCLTTFGPENL